MPAVGQTPSSPAQPDRRTIRQYRPDWVILAIGCNDIWIHGSRRTALSEDVGPGTALPVRSGANHDLDQFAALYRALIDKAMQQAGTRVLVCTTSGSGERLSSPPNRRWPGSTARSSASPSTAGACGRCMAGVRRCASPHAPAIGLCCRGAAVYDDGPAAVSYHFTRHDKQAAPAASHFRRAPPEQPGRRPVGENDPEGFGPIPIKVAEARMAPAASTTSKKDCEWNASLACGRGLTILAPPTDASPPNRSLSDNYQLHINPGLEGYDPPYGHFQGIDLQVASGWQRYWYGGERAVLDGRPGNSQTAPWAGAGWTA